MKTQFAQKTAYAPIVKLGASRQMVIPKNLSSVLDLRPGDYLEVELYEGDRLLVTPKALVDRDPRIDRRLAAAERDVREGRVSGPFGTASELQRYLQTIR